MADIRMPDGTVIRGVPDGVSKDELDQKLIAAYGRDRWAQMTGGAAPSRPADVETGGETTEFGEKVLAARKTPAPEMRPSIDDLSAGPERDAHIAEHGTWKEQQEALRRQEGKPTPTTEQQKRNRDALIVDQDEKATGSYWGFSAGGQKKTPEEQARDIGKMQRRLIDLGIDTPEDYGYSQDEFDALTEERVKQEQLRKKQRAEAQGAARAQGQQIAAPDKDEEDERSWWNYTKEAVSSIPSQIKTGLQLNDDTINRIEEQDLTIGQVYLERLNADLDTDEETRERAGEILDQAAQKYGMSSDDYMKYTGQMVDMLTANERESMSEFQDIIQEVQSFKPRSAEDSYLGHIGSLLVENVGQLGYIAAGVATRSPALTMSLMGTDIYARTYANARSDGRDPSEAAQDAFASSIIEGATEGVPVAKIASLWRAGNKSRVRKLLEGIGTEGAQEMLAELAQVGYDTGIVGKEMTMGEAFARMRDAALVGSIMGGVVAAPVAAFGDNDMQNAQSAVRDASQKLRSVSERMMNPEMQVTKEEIDSARDEYQKAVKARSKLIEQRKEAQKQKAEGKQQKRAKKRRKKLTGKELERDIAREKAEKEDQTLTGDISDQDVFMANTMDRIVAGEVTTEDAKGVEALLDAGYAKVLPSGAVALLPAGRRRLKAVRGAQERPDVPDVPAEELITPQEYARPEARQAREAVDEEIGRIMRGEEIIQPARFKGAARRKLELAKRVDQKVKDPKVASRIADDIIKAEQVEQAYQKREAQLAEEADRKRDEAYAARLQEQNEVESEVALNLARMDQRSQSGYKGTRLGDVLRNAYQTLEREEAKAQEALKDAFWNKPVQGTLFDVGSVLAKGTKDYANAVKVGALKIAKIGLNYSAWSADMVAEFGDNIKPVMARVWHDAKKRVRDVMRISHEKFQTGKRKGELKYAPKKYAKPGRLQQLRRTLEKLAKEGEAGRHWYEKSGKEILRVTGGDKQRARKLAGLLAIYSSGTSVGPNLTNALKMWSMYQGGDLKLPKQGTKAGRFGEQDRTAMEWLESSASDEYFVEKFGDKRYPFFQNLMREIDPDNYELGQGAAIDMWMMRAFGYDKDAPTTAQFAFATTEVKNLAEKLGWENQQAQAAMWVAIKSRWEYIQKEAKQKAVKMGLAELNPGQKGSQVFDVAGASREEQIENEKKIIELFRETALRKSVNEINKKLEESKQDFADYMNHHYATVSWEAEPSTKLGLNYDKMPLEAKLEMQAEIAQIMTNPETGREWIAEWLELLGQDQYIGPGSWNMSVGATVQNSVIAPPEHKPDPKNRRVQKSTRQALDGYAAIVGYLTKQDAVAWHRPFYATTMKGANGVEVVSGPLDQRQIIDLYSQIVAVAEMKGIPYETAVNWAPVALSGSVRVFNDESSSGVPNRDFHKLIAEAADAAGVSGDIEVFQADHGMPSNDWTQNTEGESYVESINQNENPRVKDAFGLAKRRLADKISKVHEKYAKKYGRVEFGQRPVSAPLSLGAVIQGGEAAAIELGTRFGTVEPGRDTNEEMRIYNLDYLVDNKEVQEQMARELGYEVKYFSFEEDTENGVKFVLPKLKKQGYKDGYVWIYDPRVAAGSFKGAVEYTRAWRISHEIGHAIAERFMQDKYGDSRRYGRLGRTHKVLRGVQGKQVEVEEKPLTLKEAQRAVEWEDVAFRTQREILKMYGIEVSNEQFAQEFNINLGDAMFRVLTGEFNDPGDRGFMPAKRPVNLKQALALLEEAEAKLAASQGREPTKGVDLSKWRKTPISALRSALRGRRKEISGIDDSDVMASMGEPPVVRIKENELDEFEVAEINGEIYYTDDPDDAVGTARRIYGDWTTIEFVDEFGETISTEEPVAEEPQITKLSLRKDTPEESADKHLAVDEFMNEFMDETSQNPISSVDERIFGSVAAVTLRPQNGEIWLDSIRSFEQGEGHGKEALEMVLELADKHGVTINLFAKPFGDGGLDQRGLVKWYERNGFYHDRGAQYVREPRNQAVPTSMAMFKKPTTKTAEGFGLPVGRVQEYLDKFGELTGITNLKAVQAVEDLPTEAYMAVASKGSASAVNGLYYNDPIDGPTIYIVSNHMYSEDVKTFGQPDVNRMVETVLHEAVGHYGTRALLGDKMYNRYMDQIIKAFPKEVERRRKQNKFSNTQLGKRLAAEEVIAYTAQDALRGTDLSKIRVSILDKIIARIKLFLSELGVGEFSRDDLLDLIWRAADFTRRTSPEILSKRAQKAQDMLVAQKAARDVDYMASLRKDRDDDPELDRFLDKIGHGRHSRMDNLRDWWSERRARLHRVFEIEVLDQYAGIKHAERDLGIFGTESGYMSVRLTAGTDVILRSALENGAPVWGAEGTVAIDETTRGLVEILAPVGQSGEMLQMFEAFIVARRSKRLRREGRERLISQEEIAAVYRYIRKNKLYKLFDQTQKEMAAYKKKVLDFAEESGLIDPETRPTWEHSDHVPFHRVLSKDKTGPFAGSRIGKIGPAIRRLKGGTQKLQNPLESIVQNIGALIEASIKNRAMADVVRNFDQTGLITKAPQAETSTALVDLKQVRDMLDEAGVSVDAVGRDLLNGIQKLYSLQAPTADNIISVQEKGKKQYYYVHDTGIMRGLEVEPNRWSGLMTALRAPKRILTRAITLTPDFILKNWFRDMWHSWVLARRGSIAEDGPIPFFDSTKGWGQAIAQNEVYRDMMAGGGMFDAGYVNAADPNRTNIAIRKALMGAGRSNILDSPRKLARFYMRIANGAENAHRIAVYQKTLKATGSRKQALFESRDLMDFSVRGANPVVRFLTETVPFWGARVQGLSRSVKGLKESPMMTLMRGAPIMLASIALYVLNREDDRYKGLNEYERAMYYHFFDVFEAGDHWRLPKPFEVGALFSSVPETLTEFMLSKEPDRGRALGHSVFFIFREMLSLWPDVQALNPIYELAINENRFTESPILTDWEKKKHPSQQYSYRTNRTVREIAQSMPDWAPDSLQSPKQLEHLLRGYFGSMMDYALVASDMVYYKTVGKEESQPPSMRWDETPFVRAFRRDTPAKYDTYLNTMYEVLEQADQIHNAINDLKKEGDREGIESYRENYAALLAARGPMNKARSQIRDINALIRKIYASERLKPTEKRERIDKLLERRSEIAERVYDYRPGGKRNKEDGGEEVESLLDSLIGQEKAQQIDKLVAAEMPHTAILVNDAKISDEKLARIVA